jgi:hypothetical protein
VLANERFLPRQYTPTLWKTAATTASGLTRRGARRFDKFLPARQKPPDQWVTRERAGCGHVLGWEPLIGFTISSDVGNCMFINKKTSSASTFQVGSAAKFTYFTQFIDFMSIEPMIAA